MLHSGMFSYHSLWGNKFTDDGMRALRAAAEERNSNPDFIKLDLNVWWFHSTCHRSALNITEQCSEPDSPTEVRNQVMWHCVSHTYCWWWLPQLLGLQRRRMEAVEICVGLLLVSIMSTWTCIVIVVDVCMACLISLALGVWPARVVSTKHVSHTTHTHTHTHTHTSLYFIAVSLS